MTNLNELDLRLRAFVNAPDNFLDSIALVNALHNIPVLASDQPYALDIEGQKVTPVFSDKEDLETFKSEQASANDQNWVERLTLDVLKEVIEKGLTGIVFNLKKTGDFGNSTIFKSSELIQFLNAYTTILNKLMVKKTLRRILWTNTTLSQLLFTHVMIKALTVCSQQCLHQKVKAMSQPFQIFKALLNGITTKILEHHFAILKEVF